MKRKDIDSVNNDSTKNRIEIHKKEKSGREAGLSMHTTIFDELRWNWSIATI